MSPNRIRRIGLSLMLGATCLAGLLLILSLTTQPAQALLGVELFVSPAGAGSACTRSAPCTLQSALAKAVNGDTIYVAGGTYTGSGGAVITLTKSISLLGGWDGGTAGAVVRDPEAHPAVLDGQHLRRVMIISGTIAPSIDGFVMTHGNATGMMAHCPGIHGTPGGCGGGIMVVDASPLIANNVIINNIGASTHANQAGYGGGLLLNNADGAVISGNLIISNTARVSGIGDGGGLHLWGSDAEVRGNVVHDNYACRSSGFAFGAGMSVVAGAPVVVGNELRDNWATPSGTDREGAGLYTYSDVGTYLDNTIVENHGGSAIFLQLSHGHFEGNRMLNNATGTGLVLSSGSGKGPTFVNNVLGRSGANTVQAKGQLATPVVAHMLHNTLVGSGTECAVYLDVYVALAMTNTIIANHHWGLMNVYPTSSTLTADHTLFWESPLNSTVGTNPVYGDPRLRGGAYHLGPASAAVDAGVAAGVTIDMDGESRPLGAGYDIGADERRPTVFLPLARRS